MIGSFCPRQICKVMRILLCGSVRAGGGAVWRIGAAAGQLSSELKRAQSERASYNRACAALAAAQFV